MGHKWHLDTIVNIRTCPGSIVHTIIALSSVKFKHMEISNIFIYYCTLSCHPKLTNGSQVWSENVDVERTGIKYCGFIQGQKIE